MDNKTGSNMYIRLCKGLSDYGKLIPSTDNIYKHIKNQKQDYYTSVYLYDEKQKEEFNISNSVSGMKDVKTNKLIFDFDSKDLDIARQDALTVISKLNNDNISSDSIDIFFSGGKGFHLVIETDDYFTPKEAKNTALKYAKGLKTFDSVVYNANRILRVPFTKHLESGLYKTPLQLDELENSTVEEIKDIAKEEYTPELTTKTKVETKQLITPIKLVEPIESSLVMDLDLSKRPKNMSSWKFALEQGFFPPGQRSNGLTILAATYRAMGYNKTKCYYSLKSAADLQSQKFGQGKFSKEEIHNNIINQVYSNTWDGGTWSEDNFPEQIKDYFEEQGIPRVDKNNDDEGFVVDVEQGFKSFEKYANLIDENTMKFGIKDLDDLLKVQTEHLIGVLAGPGVGKSSLAVTLLNSMSKQGIQSYFASYDMAQSIMFQKIVQRETKLIDEQIFDAFRNKDEKLINSFKEALVTNYKNVTFGFQSGQTVEELRRCIHTREQKIGQPIKLVVVDYLELVRTKSGDPTQASAEAVQGLREIANEGRVVIVLLQPNKMSSTPDEPVLTYNAAKGSSAIAQAVTAMVTCHRPGYGTTDDDFFCINVVKSRMGALGSASFSWHGPTGMIGQICDSERQRLKELKALKKLEKSDEFGD